MYSSQQLSQTPNVANCDIRNKTAFNGDLNIAASSLFLTQRLAPMPRTIRDSSLESRAARSRLQPRGDPYWRLIERGKHLGYRRNRSGAGAWLERHFVNPRLRYRESSLGAADDLGEGTGLTFFDAVTAARAAWQGQATLSLADNVSGPTKAPTVARALDDYIAARIQRGVAKSLSKDRQAIALHILPTFANVEIAKLTTKQIRDWQSRLVGMRLPVSFRGPSG
jgi:Phage integrase, N-terminal SAM-like domain